MLPKQYRLKRSKDFARARRSGRSAGTSLIGLYVSRTRSPEVRIGFSVNKRVGKAVIRNRVKRLLREAVRPHLAGLRLGHDLVFIARPPAADASLAQIEDAVSQLLCKTGASRQKPGARNA